MSRTPNAMPEGRRLLASDLDGTVVPTPGVEGDGGIAAFRHVVTATPDLLLAYVTGRSFDLAIDGMRRYRLPPPDLLVCDVGTSVFRLLEGEYVPDPGYRELMLSALDGADLPSVRGRLSDVEGLELQEEHHQAEFKLSYYTMAGPEGETLAVRAREKLEDVGRFSVVFSVDPVDQGGLLDVLPSGIAKDAAVRYMHDATGVPEDRVVYAGDSGNDRSAMLSGFSVVVVGNAPLSLKESIRAQAEDLGLADRIYFATASFAAGVLEGCRHFRLV